MTKVMFGQDGAMTHHLMSCDDQGDVCLHVIIIVGLGYSISCTQFGWQRWCLDICRHNRWIVTQKNLYTASTVIYVLGT